MPNRKKRNYRDLADVKTEEELNRAEKNGNHRRSQELRDAMNKVMCLAIYLISGSVVLGTVAIAIHWIATGNWGSFQSSVKSLAYIVGGYIVSYLQMHGLKQKE